MATISTVLSLSLTYQNFAWVPKYYHTMTRWRKGKGEGVGGFSGACRVTLYAHAQTLGARTPMSVSGKFIMTCLESRLYPCHRHGLLMPHSSPCAHKKLHWCMQLFPLLQGKADPGAPDPRPKSKSSSYQDMP